MSNELPNGWAECEMGAVAKVVGGGTPDSQDPDNFSAETGIPWLTPADLSDNKAIHVARGKRFLTKKGFDNSSARLVPKGTVLFSSRAPIGYVAVAANEISTNQGFKSFVCAGGISSEYIYFWLRFATPIAEELASGTTFAEISGKNAAKIPLRLAPFAEQQRIVVKLETLLGKVDACQRRLVKIPVLLKRFRQSVLAAACSGRLTADWREEKHKIESAADFTRRVQVERKAAYDRDCSTAAAKGERKPKRPTNEFTAVIDEEADDLPDLWCVTRIGDISDCLDHIRVPINKTERLKRQGTVPYYGANGQVGFIDNFLFDEELVLVVEDETFIGREKPFSYIVMGKTWVNNHAHVLRALGGMPTEFLNICLSYYDFVPLTSGTTGRRKLTQEGLVEAPLRIAPLAEQQEIVRRVEALFALADQLEARFTKAKAHVEKLTPSLLAKAFRGELVPQDPNDEPASALLQRVQISDHSTPAGAGTRKGRRR